MHFGFFPDATAKVVAVVLVTFVENTLNLRVWPGAATGFFAMIPASGIDFRDRCLPPKKWGIVEEDITKVCSQKLMTYVVKAVLGLSCWQTFPPTFRICRVKFIST